MKKVRIQRSRKKTEFAASTFLPGMRGQADWHVRLLKKGETPHTINLMGTKGEMVLPPADSDKNKFIRLHELLHAAHSPVESPRPVMRPDGSFIRVDALQCAEEFRMNLYGRALLGHWQLLPDNDDLIRDEIKAMAMSYVTSPIPSTIVEMVKWMMISWPLDRKKFTDSPRARVHVGMMLTNGEVETDQMRNPYDVMTFTASEVYYNIWDEELMRLASDERLLPSWESVLKLASFLSDMFDNLEAPKSEMEKGTGGDSEADEDPDIKKSRERTYARRPRANTMLDDIKEMMRGHKFRPEYHISKGKSGAPEWAKMTIRRGLMNLKLPKNFLARSKFQATDEGANPRYPHRLLTDGKVFSRKKKSSGGSVLIDDSGSMSWTTEQLVEILEEAPAVNIAAYSGHSGRGELVILAENGRYADMGLNENHPSGGDNLVDLPALEWLASQPKPRLWVSDTMITLVSGDAEEGYEQCIQICKDYDINIVETPKEAGQVFRGEKVIYR